MTTMSLRGAPPTVVRSTGSSRPSGPRMAPRSSQRAPPKQEPEEKQADSPEAMKIIEMAMVLGIDPATEFYLLPIAKHALESPGEWFASPPPADSSLSPSSLPASSSSLSSSSSPSSSTLPPTSSSSLSPSASLPVPMSASSYSSSSLPPSSSTTSSSSPSLISSSSAPFTSLSGPPSSSAAPPSPSASVSASASGLPPPRSDFEWFRRLIDTERTRHATTPNIDASPWLRLTDSMSGVEYFYNFRSHRRADSLPRSRSSHGSTSGTADAAAADGPVKFDPTAVEVMKFTSWWLESTGERRYINIKYTMSSEEFEINIDKDDKLYRLSEIKSKHGPATCWDLHLRASLTILGRPTTLMQCDADTRLWIESNAKRLLRLKDALEKKLAKYEKVNTINYPVVPLAQTHLRPLMRDIAKLKNQFAKYRPSIAAQYDI